MGFAGGLFCRDGDEQMARLFDSMDFTVETGIQWLCQRRVTS